MNVVELRRYALRPGRRDDLISLFEREFVESQEHCGIRLIGWYRDLDDPDAFVWFRGFDSMAQRAEALAAFYERSPSWLENRDQANATMLDSDNVLLLRPARSGSGFDAGARARELLAAVSIFMLPKPADEAYLTAFERNVRPQLERIAANVAYFVTDPSPNTFARLPVREGEWAFVVAGLCSSAQAIDEWHALLNAPESLRLEPTGISCRR